MLNSYAMASKQGGYTGEPFDFEVISHTLTKGGSVNNITYSGILEDEVISENEIRYLSILKDGIDTMIDSMTSEKESLREKEDITVSKMDSILGEFFKVWNPHSEDFPVYFLERKQ